MISVLSYRYPTFRIHQPSESIVSKKPSSKSRRNRKSNRSSRSHGAIVPQIYLTTSAASLIEGMDSIERELFEMTLPDLLTSEEVTSCIQVYGSYRAVVTHFDTQFVVESVGCRAATKGHSSKPGFVLDTYDQHAPGDLQPPSWLGSFQPLLRTAPLPGLQS